MRSAAKGSVAGVFFPPLNQTVSSLVKILFIDSHISGRIWQTITDHIQVLLTSVLYRLPDQKPTVRSSLFAALYRGRHGLALHLQDAVSSFSQAYHDMQRGKGR